MEPREPFVDIHCHLIPAMDDGATSWRESLAMARMAQDDGIRTVIATPHQLGTFAHNGGASIRRSAEHLAQYLASHDVDVEVLPGADVRIEPNLIQQLQSGEVLSLGDHRKHVLLELPHEMYFPLETCLEDLARIQMVGILSHPERNQGLLRRPDLIRPLIDQGCLMQVTAGSLLGTFGDRSRELAERMLVRGWVHFIATDAHGYRSRRPLMKRAFLRVTELTDVELAHDLCCRNPALVASGQVVPPLEYQPSRPRSVRWFPFRRAA